jgi:hypothetical protein
MGVFLNLDARTRLTRPPHVGGRLICIKKKQRHRNSIHEASLTASWRALMPFREVLKTWWAVSAVEVEPSDFCAMSSEASGDRATGHHSRPPVGIRSRKTKGRTPIPAWFSNHWESPLRQAESSGEP